MVAFEKEKRKNDERGRFPWWLLVIGFVLGAAAMLIVSQSSSPSVNADLLSAYSREELALNATAIAEQLTSMGTNGVEGIEPLAITATTIILQATQQRVMTAIAPSP